MPRRLAAFSRWHSLPHQLIRFPVAGAMAGMALRPWRLQLWQLRIWRVWLWLQPRRRLGGAVLCGESSPRRCHPGAARAVLQAGTGLLPLRGATTYRSGPEQYGAPAASLGPRRRYCIRLRELPDRRSHLIPAARPVYYRHRLPRGHRSSLLSSSGRSCTVLRAVVTTDHRLRLVTGRRPPGYRPGRRRYGPPVAVRTTATCGFGGVWRVSGQLPATDARSGAARRQCQLRRQPDRHQRFAPGALQLPTIVALPDETFAFERVGPPAPRKTNDS
jgi:hypothetical protein